MSHETNDDGAWFAAKRTGIGAGRPITWQGWLTFLIYLGAMVGAGFLVRNGHTGGRWAGWAVMALVTGLFCVIAARRTQGGWKWRWGGKYDR